MHIITVSGPPSSGKTSVILHLAKLIQADGLKPFVAKFDCLYTADDEIYQKAGIPALKALSGPQCPDHFFVANIEDAFFEAQKHKADILISESAGLCNRCSPYIKDIFGVCVIDNLSGINTPRKLGPLLKQADFVVITKGDIVSQAEREVFATKTFENNPKAAIMHINGLTGQGCAELYRYFKEHSKPKTSLKGHELRFPMPSALCSYCLGQTKIGEEYQSGNIRKFR